MIRSVNVFVPVLQSEAMTERRPIQRKTLAQEMADTLTEEIVSGQRRPGETLPTEPELATEFQVSRSVVRDATRILAARGLVTVQHGRGAFVTESQLDAFSEALLLALRREGASVWDVEELFKVVLPEVCAMAAERASGDELAAAEAALEGYLKTFATVARSTVEERREVTPAEEERIRSAYGSFLTRLFHAAHNPVFSLLASPFLAVQTLREWESPSATAGELIHLERSALEPVLGAMKARDPDGVRRLVTAWFDLPDEAVDAMRNTTVGRVAHIPTSLSDFARQRGYT